MEIPEGLAVAVLVGGVLGYTVVLAIRDWRVQARKDRNPEHPWIEVLEPGEKPITDPLLTKEGGLYTVKGFGNFWKYPRLGDAPKPPTSTERS